ncbi:hypothetical protein FOXB_02938 [Fusarium oxysporum f. sp. conglutinans Fo5176]|uniref:DDE-1 domain-containing protein n=1 Tax=Fusarium oxysporum (strain Fo5176) TaxID=660025 RepID=F9F963_FUSOF|nr:hypothetical protein FOXB_02938 [Fusarium oxysporum f. sp. conglutinans Fo5176]
MWKRWASNFIKRQPELKACRFRRYDYKRAKYEDPEGTRGWLALVENTIAKYSIDTSHIYNFDKTGFMMSIILTGMVVTSAESSFKAKLAYPGNREWVMMIQGVSSEGWCVSPFAVVAGENHLSTWYRESPLPQDWDTATTDNG